MTTVTPTTTILSDTMLARFAERAPVYDRENRFFREDFEELRDAGYLKIALPAELGGRGLNLAEVAREQRRLAYHAPATALATNMHLYWTGVAADLHRLGDGSFDWLLEEAAAGEVFAAGHGEAGNDLPLLLSSAKAERVDGGYRLSGHKIFGSLSPVWTRLGLHAMDADDPRGPQIVHAFMRRDTPGFEIKETWDVLGMRATRSDDTLLQGAFVPDRYIPRVLPIGFGGADLFVVAVFAWGLLNFGSIYTGLAERARDLAVAAVQQKTAVAISRTMAHHPEIQHAAAEMELALDAMSAHIERTTQDWSAGVDHGAAWPAKIVSAKYHCVEGAKHVVDLAMDMSGGAGMFKRNELERLYRDVRCGGFHPANRALTYEIVGKTTLGVSFTDALRWG